MRCSYIFMKDTFIHACGKLTFVGEVKFFMRAYCYSLWGARSILILHMCVVGRRVFSLKCTTCLKFEVDTSLLVERNTCVGLVKCTHGPLITLIINHFD